MPDPTPRPAPERLVIAAALLGGTGVLAGAFGAHALSERLELTGKVELWETAVRYQVWHALALLALAALRPGPAARWVGRAFVVGAILFSGSLYGLALEGPGPILGPITPLGGLALMAGWLVLGALAASGRLFDHHD